MEQPINQPDLQTIQSFLGQMEAGELLLHRFALQEQGDWFQPVFNWEMHCTHLLEVASRSRESEDEQVAMYGFRLQMLVHELLEAKRLEQDVEHVHIREIKKQTELLHLAIERANLTRSSERDEMS